MLVCYILYDCFILFICCIDGNCFYCFYFVVDCCVVWCCYVFFVVVIVVVVDVDCVWCDVCVVEVEFVCYV